MLSIQMLGPLRAEIDGSPVELGGPRQRAVLAVLLVGRGRVVSADRLIDRLWSGEPPPKAIASLQAYISHLRRALEPQRRPRSPAEVLISAAPGYAVSLPETAVDAWHFEAALRRARAEPTAGAVGALEESLDRWQGRPLADMADEDWAVDEVIRLEELRRQARELVIAHAVTAGRAAEAASAASALVRDDPLREEGWRLLAQAQWADGRRAEALVTLRDAARVIAAEVGMPPGPRLAELEKAMREQRSAAILGTGPAGSSRSAQASPWAQPAQAVAPALATVQTWPELEEEHETDDQAGLFVGRKAEVDALIAAARAAQSGGGVVLVSGAAGAGKSALLARFRQRLRADGWSVIAGRCPESEGAPPAWAWVEALGRLAETHPPPPGSPVAAFLREHGPDGDATAGRFHLHRAFTAWLRAASRAVKIAICIDDLHRADGETLALVERAAELPGAPVLLVAAYRPNEASDRLGGTLAALAPRSPRRLALGGLPAADVDALVTAVCGAPVDPGTIDALTARTGGNPFYVWESARLMASEGVLVALSEVPHGVRDVLQRRLRRLPEPAVDVLRLVAVAGLEVELSVLLAASEMDEESVLDGIEAAVVTGLLTEPSPGRLRLEHALVRDTIYHGIVGIRRARLHARLADALRRTNPDDYAALAYHFGQAGTAGTAPLAVEYALRAAEVAERRYAHDTAVELLTQAVDAFGRVPADAAERTERLVELLGRLMRAQIRAGSVLAARQTRQLAVDAARDSDRDDLVAAAFAAWTEPTPWHIRPYGYVDRTVLDTLDRLAVHPDFDPVTQSRLQQTTVEELFGADNERAEKAARRQLELAEKIGDPALLAAAITSMTRSMPHELQADRREPHLARLRELTARHDLPAYRWVCEHVAGMIAGARGEADRVRHHAEEGLIIARRYRLVEPEAVNLATLAMLAHIEGRFAEAEERYTDVRDQLTRQGSGHAADIYEVGLISIWRSQRRDVDLEPRMRRLYGMFGSPVGPSFATTLAYLRRFDEARAIRCPKSRRPPPDSMYSINLECRAERAAVLGDRDEAPELIRLMLPLRDQLAGAASTTFASRPVAQAIGELYRMLGDTEQARQMFELAETVALRWGSPHLAAAARTA